MALFAAGNMMPDVLMMMTAYLPQFVTLGALQDLGPYTRLDRTARLDDQWPAFRRLNSIAGKGPYQMHYDLWTYCIYINKDLFKAANVPDPTTRLPDYWTWDEFRAAAIKLTGFAERGGSVYGFGPRLNLWPLADPILRSHGGGVISADNSRCLLDTPESVTVMEQIVELFLKNQAAPAVQDNQIPRLFESGRLAMEIAGLDRAGRYRDRIKNFQWDVAPLPVANRTRQKTNWVQASGLSIGRTTLQVEGAWRFINFTTSAENLAEMLGKPVRGLPARPSLREMIAQSDLAPRQLKLFPDAAEWGVCNTVSNFDAFVKLIGPANDALYGGSVPVATIFRELTPQIDALLRPL
jgi:multiple sugar transport system substrate-binding protein